MSVWKTINPNDFSTETIQVHKKFSLDQASAGQEFLQFKSGSSEDFSSNQSGSHWDANRVHFYLSGSQFDFSDLTSSYYAGGMFSHPGLTFTIFDGDKPQHLNKFHSTGSTLSITQQYFGNSIRRKSFELIDNSHPSGTVIIQDDGYGNLYAPSASISSSTNNLSSSDNYVGNIFYNLGIVNITATGSFSHTPSTASVDFHSTQISHSQELHISGSDLSTTFKFMINSGSITGSDETNLFYVESASGHSETSESAFITAQSMSKKINSVFNLSSPSGSYISASNENIRTFSTSPKLFLSNVNKPNKPIHNIDNLPPITASVTPTIGMGRPPAGMGFGGGVAPVNYTTVGNGLDGGIGSGSYTFKFDSTTDINTREYILKVKKQDFNYTNNLTARTFGNAGSSSLFSPNTAILKDDILSGSLSGSWGPHMTTIGFYREISGSIDTRPIMVARYPQPIIIRDDIDLIFKIKIDF